MSFCFIACGHIFHTYNLFIRDLHVVEQRIPSTDEMKWKFRSKNVTEALYFFFFLLQFLQSISFYSISFIDNSPDFLLLQQL